MVPARGNVPQATVPALAPEIETLHGAVRRPPGACWDGERYAGPQLARVDRASAEGLAGLRALVVRGNFVGVVAGTAVQAAEAAARLAVEWSPSEGVRPETTEALVVWPPPLRASGPVERQAQAALARQYRWRSAESPASTWAIAWHRPGQLTVWAACDAAPRLKLDLAALVGLPVTAVTIWPNGQPASEHAVDAAADAVLLSLHIGQPVRVDDVALPSADSVIEIQLRMPIDPGATALPGYGVSLAHAPWRRPSIASLLTGRVQARRPHAAALPAYALVHPVLEAPSAEVLLAGASPAPGAAAPAFVFAHESFIDEMAHELGADPVDFRLQRLDDPRGAALVRSVWQRAGAVERQPGQGRGFAYASLLDDRFDPPRQTWSAWVADVVVDPRSGEVEIVHVVVGHDAEQLPAATDAPTQVAQQVQRVTSGLFTSAARFDEPAGRPAAGQGSPALPPMGSIEVVPAPMHDAALPRALAWSDDAALPAAAAVANAIFDATGVRLREPPFDGAPLRRESGRSARGPLPAMGRWAKAALMGCGSVVAALAGLLVTAAPWRAPIAPVGPVDLSVYSPAAIERGRRVAAAGDCVVCHTVQGGAANAGGLGLHTPFGTVYSTNITPDAATGIGAWSFTAFDRAMRHGIHRDGRHLYPAFPYTAFAKLSDGDMQALYAYLMSQPAVASAVPETKLAWPYNLRWAMAGWNLLFHEAGSFVPDQQQSPDWNRGAYLVQGAGHCGGCHTPRNALGAEKTGTAHFLSGGEADGWEAPALNAQSRSPLPWTFADFYDYLRIGYSPRHGAAAGPMAPVIHGLSALPDSDIRAMAIYLASLQPASTSATALSAAQAADLERRSAPDGWVLSASAERGERLYQGACAVCHEAQSGPTLFGGRPSLATSTNLHSDRPDNLLQVILHGIAQPAHADLGTMPGFKDSLDDGQVADLLSYLQARFTAGQADWTGVADVARQLRRAALPR